MYTVSRCTGVCVRHHHCFHCRRCASRPQVLAAALEACRDIATSSPAAHALVGVDVPSVVAGVLGVNVTEELGTGGERDGAVLHSPSAWMELGMDILACPTIRVRQGTNQDAEGSAR